MYKPGRQWLVCVYIYIYIYTHIYTQDSYISCLQETHFRSKDTYRLKVRGWKNGIPYKWKEKESLGRDFLEVPWLRLCTSTAGSTGLNPGLETKITDAK